MFFQHFGKFEYFIKNVYILEVKTLNSYRYGILCISGKQITNLGQAWEALFLCFFTIKERINENKNGVF